jgi:prepilin-type N-terminal cleavage/methylation domain-containing protein
MMSRQHRGFTLIELIVVMAIVATILMMVTMRIEHLSPKYALRAAAREVGATVDLARGTSAGRGTMTAIEYDLDHGLYTLYGQRKDGQPGNGPWGLEQVGAPRSLPRGVRFKGLFANEKGLGMQQRGVKRVRFDPLSIEGSHIVYLESEATQKQISVKYNALLGSCDYVDGTAEFEAPPE